VYAGGVIIRSFRLNSGSVFRGTCENVTHSGAWYIALFTVRSQILDENDNAPVFLHPVAPTPISGEYNASASDADVVVLWNQATSGHVVITVTASDADEGPNAEVEYSLIDDGDDRLFEIDRKLGDVTLSRSLRGDLDDQVKPIVWLQKIGS